MKTHHIIMLVASAAFFAGCAGAPPKELSSARLAYQQASEGPAAQRVPAELHKAKKALVLAEESFEKEPDSYKTKDLAYLAQRKAEQAAALGAMANDTASKDTANADYQTTQTEMIEQGKQDLADTKQQAQQALTDSEIKRNQDLLESEKRTVAALAKLVAVREEERGLVLTLSGSILFRSNQADLLATAQTKLDQVVETLLAGKVGILIVEGHTDSQGTQSYNQGLSQRRADAVRNYMVQKGYPADRIVARGKGEDSPIANNAASEGRANNRRVEIVIEREAKTSKP
jgi:outer membrane protein OmpA-like peptidoglycan-associated protein